MFELRPSLDEEGMLRMGGRLSQATLHPHVKHPAILLKTSHILDLLIKHFHERVHQGRGMIVNELRANGLWILGSHIYTCVKCGKNRRNLKVNDTVLLQDDQAPRNDWKLARITDVYPGSDDRVRKVRLLASDTTFGKGKSTTKIVFLERPVHKLVILLEADPV